MKTVTVAFLLTALALCLPGRGAAQGPPQLKPDTKAVVQDNNAFAFDLYAQLRAQPGNLFYSPYSISSALAMTYAGARGDTAVEMATALRFALPPERLHDGFGELIRELNSQDRPRRAQLSVANRLWGQQDYGFLPAFLKLTQDHYRAGLKEVDFIHDQQREQARQEINGWVGEQTKGKIRDLLGPDVLNEKTRLVLTNVIYFKGDWHYEFRKQDTVDGPFFVTPSDKVTVKLMNTSVSTNFGDFGDLKVLELPYQDHEMSMVLLLPSKLDGLAELEKGLTAAQVKQWTEKLGHRAVRLTLPKFKGSTEFALNERLKALGMVRAFRPDLADFSGMATRDKLFIAAVVHKAFVDVNEVGTEAAAATAVVAERPVSRPLKPVVFRADHPFVYLIRDNRTGSILFVGRLANPKVE
jgi:serpin B